MFGCIFLKCEGWFGLSTQINWHQGHVVTHSWAEAGYPLCSSRNDIVMPSTWSLAGIEQNSLPSKLCTKQIFFVPYVSCSLVKGSLRQHPALNLDDDLHRYICHGTSYLIYSTRVGSKHGFQCFWTLYKRSRCTRLKNLEKPCFDPTVSSTVMYRAV